MTDYDPLKADLPELVQSLAAEGIVGEQQQQRIDTPLPKGAGILVSSPQQY